MMDIKNLKTNKTRKGKLFTFFVVMVFGILIGISNVFAASFEYSDFDWDTFYEARKDFWEDVCRDSDGNVDATCNYEVLKAQKKFYTKFYKTLAKYDKKGLHINDDIILETVFYEMNPSQFADNAQEYLDNYYESGYDLSSKNGLYIIDESDLDDPDIEDNYTDQSAAEYYQKENDTIKTLVKNMISNSTSCYGIYGDPTTHTASDGSTYNTCDSGGNLTNIKGRGLKCADTLQAKNELGFWQYYVSKWAYDETLPVLLRVSFLLLQPEDEYHTSCKAVTGYSGGTVYVYNDSPEVSTDRYFDFLSYNTYFDSKVHLQSHFKENVLDPAGVDCLTSSVCENSLEAKGEYDKYEGELINSRREIIADIIGILNNYGYDITYDPLEANSYNESESQDAQRKTFYWPIGSDTTEEKNGIIYADGDPASTNIISYFGTRTSPITGETEDHYGIDISGTNGETNVIAVYRGEVVAVVDYCTVGDTTCNDGYGNMVILSHSNGDYTVYAHLASIDSSITIGSTVDKGQLIGKVGMTGATIEACLHFELRKGGNSVDYAVDPLSYLSVDSPRPSVAAGDFSVHETSLTKEEFVSKLRSYCNTSKCSNDFYNVFVVNAETVYDESIKNNVNPELVVIRGAKEGMSPGGNTHNYWGIGCYNGAGVTACSTYSSLSAGIAGFAKAVSKYDTVSEMMSKYAYIGHYWYNPGSWSDGGCKYYPYIKSYMSDERSNYVNSVCNGSSCSTSGGGSCVATNDEDQTAYTLYNIRGMVDMRYVAFGL
jgi:murein DD-endopeptidase MepM/ murein hydrolase activator NlpD